MSIELPSGWDFADPQAIKQTKDICPENYALVELPVSKVHIDSKYSQYHVLSAIKCFVKDNFSIELKKPTPNTLKRFLVQQQPPLSPEFYSAYIRDPINVILEVYQLKDSDWIPEKIVTKPLVTKDKIRIEIGLGQFPDPQMARDASGQIVITDRTPKFNLVLYKEFFFEEPPPLPPQPQGPSYETYYGPLPVTRKSINNPITDTAILKLINTEIMRKDKAKLFQVLVNILHLGPLEKDQPAEVVEQYKKLPALVNLADSLARSNKTITSIKMPYSFNPEQRPYVWRKQISTPQAAPEVTNKPSTTNTISQEQVARILTAKRSLPIKTVALFAMSAAMLVVLSYQLSK